MKKGFFLILSLLIAGQAWAQISGPGGASLLDERRAIYQNLQQEIQSYSLSKEEKVAITESLGIPLVIDLDNSRAAHFQYIDEGNHPVYYTTHNVSAAVTTGTNALQAGGSLNLSLAGQDMIVGIYDQTRPRANHNEFGNRVTQIDGSTEAISNHATHVTGTILAAGNNANAKGMANASIGWAFNWDADISKMTQNGYDPDIFPEGHLVSNHSYGILVGWFRDANNNWAWSGNESVSSSEDYRFGFYTNKSRQIDELAYSKPYYTIVWAAGNDRSDVGDGSRDSDGPDDSIGPEGVAKNSLTIGAVARVDEYTGPLDIQMSSFSSWGPVDDGRIKPDLVGMGVNVFSSSIVNDGAGDGYASLSGTSMAAPNVTGSLLLLQELFQNRNAGRYMHSATVKALAIQTAKEAGMNPGPDYMHGWGLLDAEAAARMIIEEDGSSNIIREVSLQNNETYELEFISNGLDPIRATIAWTDPAGTPPSPSLNPANLMLVNDLDMRIIDEAGNTYFPWTLNPGEGASSVAQNNSDNFRDNVEQVFIPNPAPQTYTLQIRHKGTLTNGVQPFSLVFSAGVSDGQANTLYWIGEDGSWENPNNWSLSNNGPSANQVPDEGTRVVIDQLADAETISLENSIDVFSLNIFGQNTVVLYLNDFDLNIRSGFRSSNNLTSIRNGKLHFEGEDENENVLDFGQINLSEIEMIFENGRWRVISLPELQRIEVLGAEINFDLPQIQLDNLVLDQDAKLGGRLQEVIFKEGIAIIASAEIEPGLGFRFEGENGSFSNESSIEIRQLVQASGLLNLNASGDIGNLHIISGEMRLSQPEILTNRLELNRGAILEIGDGSNLTVMEDLIHGESGSGVSQIRSAGKATIVHDLYRKYCFLNLNITNVDLVGEAVVNLGPTASVENGENWLNISCENVLFANFEVRFNCAGALTEFVNLTEGNVTSYRWNFGGLGTSSAENPSFIFNNARSYPVSLEVRGPGGLAVYEQRVTISTNSLSQPNIVMNGARLTSQVPASAYQWYRNGMQIEGANERSYQAEDGGSYQVAVIDDQCNRVSDVVVISSSGDGTFAGRAGYAIGPNPVNDQLSLFINNSFRGEVIVSIVDSSGQLKQEAKFDKALQGMEFVMDFEYPRGLYLVQVQAGNERQAFKVIKD